VSVIEPESNIAFGLALMDWIQIDFPGDDRHNSGRFMPSLKHLALIGFVAAAIGGCDASSPDNQAREKMNEGRVAAATGDEAGRTRAQSLLTEAANVTDASSASVAQAKAVLGQVQYEAGLEMLRDADRKELEASKIALQIAALGSQLGNSATLVQGYQKQDPIEAKADIQKKIGEVEGGPSQTKWISDANIASLSAADQEVSRVQGEIASRENQIKDLSTRRDALLADADKSLKASESAKGQESVDAYKKYSDTKKQASDLGTQIDLLKGQLMPLQNDLATAQGQQRILQGAIAEFQKQSQTLDTGWKDVQSKIAAQVDLMKEIASGSDSITTQPAENTSAAGKSISVKATILAQTVKESNEARDNAEKMIEDAAKNFEAASSSANNAWREMSELEQQQPQLRSILKIAEEGLSELQFRQQQAVAERVLGELYLSKAEGISARIKLRDLLTPIMQQAGQAMPPELSDAGLDKALKDALEASNQSFKDSLDHLADIIDGRGSGSLADGTKRAASLTRIFVLYGQQQLAILQGNNGAASKAHADAVAAVKAAADLQVMFPTLPGDLAAAIPPPPAPASSPSDAAPATQPG
jgi:hypothetical protein